MATMRRQIDKVDRISDLSECILHHILSFLGTKEACRTCVLSKKWSNVWDTVPFLDFHSDYFIKENLEFRGSSPPSKFDLEYYEKDSVDRYVNFIDRTMHRYSQQNLSIQKLKLTLPMLDPGLACVIDTWLQIAVINCLEELSLSFLVRDSPSYTLPEILFSAKSLKFLKCHKVELPYYQGMKLTSLQILNLDTVIVDEGMLQRIICSCPLIDLEISSCFGLANISIPSLSKLGCLKVCSVNANLNIDQETGSLRHFVYHGDMESWPCKINASALRNLKELKIYCAGIADEVFLDLMTTLSLVHTLALCVCYTFRNLSISTKRLMELHLHDCDDLENAVIDAPNLALFTYTGHPEMSLTFTNIRPQCDAYFHIYAESALTPWFVKLKKFMVKSNICKVLNILLPSNMSESKVNVDKLMKILVGPAYELREIKLCLSHEWMPTQSSLSAFLDAVFLICRPAAFSVSTCLDLNNTFVKTLMDVLYDKVKCWNHPLRGVQVESIECPGLSEHKSGDMDLTFGVKLCW